MTMHLLLFFQRFSLIHAYFFLFAFSFVQVSALVIQVNGVVPVASASPKQKCAMENHIATMDPMKHRNFVRLKRVDRVSFVARTAHAFAVHSFAIND